MGGMMYTNFSHNLQVNNYRGSHCSNNSKGKYGYSGGPNEIMSN